MHKTPSNLQLYIEKYPAYLRLARDGAAATIKEYLHDLDRYIKYFKTKVDPTLESFCFSATYIRGFVMFLREAKNTNATIERRLHGVYAFWMYLHLEHNHPPPVPIKYSGVRIKKIRNPTRPIGDKNFLNFMQKVEDELSKIN